MALEIVAVGSSTSTSPQCLDFIVDRPSKYNHRSVIAITKAQRWLKSTLASDPVNKLIYDKLVAFDSSASDLPEFVPEVTESLLKKSEGGPNANMLLTR